MEILLRTAISTELQIHRSNGWPASADMYRAMREAIAEHLRRIECLTWQASHRNRCGLLAKARVKRCVPQTSGADPAAVLLPSWRGSENLSHIHGRNYSDHRSKGAVRPLVSAF